MYVYLCSHLFIYKYLSLYIYKDCMYIFMYMCVCVCACYRICVYIFIYRCIYSYIYMYIYIYTHLRICVLLACFEFNLALFIIPFQLWLPVAPPGRFPFHANQVTEAPVALDVSVHPGG